MGDRNWKLRDRYGLTESVYQSILIGQNFRCAICGREHTEDQKLQVDHHQNNGKDYISGLLCLNCNSFTAHARHDPKILEAGIEYLKRR